ncbi:unnamed protein product [Rotaria sp. Silwood1]|nr:unnamed protein product [Rotaria sp. Silwood1]
MPTLMGWDADAPLAEGEVGICGVSVSSLADMERLFDGIPLDKNNDEVDFWDELTPEQQARILKAEKQCENGEGVDNETVMKKLAEWISK